MRDVIARALVWVLRMALPARGRHGATPATVPAPSPEPAPTDSWSTPTPRSRTAPKSRTAPRSGPTPWLTPTPAHVRALRAPLRGEDVVLVRPYVLADTARELGVVQERRRAAELATLGVDYPYTYPGAPFTRSAFATAGVPA
ncbi:hypothetical protein [Streptomyces sparsus]